MKKIIAMAAAVLMAATAIVAPVSAADSSASTWRPATPDGKAWATVVEETFDGKNVSNIVNDSSKLYLRKNTTVDASIVDGKLVIGLTCTDNGVGNAFYTIIPDSAELDAVMDGEYLLEYDVKYLEANNTANPGLGLGAVIYNVYNQDYYNGCQLYVGGWWAHGHNKNGAGKFTDPATGETISISIPSSNRMTGNASNDAPYTAGTSPTIVSTIRPTVTSPASQLTAHLLGYDMHVSAHVLGDGSTAYYVNGVYIGGTDADKTALNTNSPAQNDSKYTYEGKNDSNTSSVNSAIAIHIQNDAKVEFDNIRVLKLADAIAAIGDTQYPSFEAAYAAVQGGETITMYKDLTFTAKQKFTKSFTLDLNGRTLTFEKGDNVITGGVNVTIKNGTIDMDGIVSNGNAAINLGYYDKTVNTLTLDGITLNADEFNSACGIFYVSENSTLTIKNESVLNISNNNFNTYYGVIYGDPKGATTTAGTVVIDNSTANFTDTDRGIIYADVVLQNGAEVNMTKTASGEFTDGFFNCNLTVDDSKITATGLTGDAISVGTEYPDWTFTTAIKNESIVSLTDCKIGTYGNNVASVNVDDTSILSVKSANVTDAELDTLFPAGWVRVDGVVYSPKFTAVVKVSPSAEYLPGGGVVKLTLDCNVEDIIDDLVITCDVDGVVVNGTGAVRTVAIPNGDKSYTFTVTLPEDIADLYDNPTDSCTVRAMSESDAYWLAILMKKYNTTYPVTAVAGEGGTITNAGVNSVKYNQNISFEIKANEGYAIADVLVNGVSVGKVDAYTISKVTEAQTITAVFEKTYTNPYSDVAENAWYADAVQYCTENGLMNGTETTKFAPDAALNRAMVVTVLHRLEGEPEATSAVSFFDVPATEYYAKAVDWASANKIVEGDGAGLFAPTAEITLEQLAAIMVRYANAENVKLTAGSTDGLTVSDWAADEVAAAISLFEGVGVDTKDVTKVASRAVVAQVLYNYAQLAK